MGADWLRPEVSGEAGGRGTVGSHGGRRQENRGREGGDGHFASEEEEMGSSLPFCVQVSTNASDSYFRVRGQHSNINRNKAILRLRPVPAPLFLEGSDMYGCQPLDTRHSQLI